MTSDESPIRVLYVINGLGTGGAERSLAEMLNPLRDRGIQVTIACLYRREEGLQDSVIAAGHDVRFLGPSLTRGILRLRSLLREINPHIIHTTLFEADILGRLSSIGRPAKVISSIVNTSYALPITRNPDVSPRKLRLVRAIDAWTARAFNDRFHALTKSVANAAVDALGIDCGLIDVIPRGRSRERLGESSADRRRKVRTMLGVDDSTTLLLSVGRREHQKGQIHAVEALSLLTRSRSGLLLLVVGREGRASERLYDLVRSVGLEHSVRFLDHRDDVPDLMAASDVLVFPSLFEGLGGTVIEAMALGLPAVVSDIPAIREITDNGAVFVTPGSAESLADGIRQVIDDPGLAAQLVDAGRHRFETHYTIDRVADQIADMYRSVTTS